MTDIPMVIDQIDPLHRIEIGRKYQLGEPDQWFEVVGYEPVADTSYMVDGGWLTPRFVRVSLRETDAP